MRLVIFLISLSLLLTACSAEQLTRYKIMDKDEKTVLEAEGYAPINTQPGPSYEEKLMQAMEASREEAYERLAEQIYGVKVRARTSVDDQGVEHEVREVRVEGIVRGAAIVAHGIDGKMYTTKLTLDKSVLDELDESVTESSLQDHPWWY
ncbi:MULTISPECIES: LPP20 family lipoprotein [Marinobacter]|uniref:LPP20 family lipoprotein n=1 Tax=Marinobacter TaxID=2742 RepID=UPI000DABDA49|nr:MULTISPECIES: hypothetical protein [Marinobacter]